MLKKFAIGLAFIISVSVLAVFAGCGTVDYDEKFSDRAKVVFELEGGRYLNSTTSVSHYYTLEDGKPCRIVALEDMPEGEVTRDGGFLLEGWYKTKTVTDGNAEYSDKWNFDTDTVTADGATLYAKWESPIVFSFDFVYIDANGEEQKVQSYKVNAGNRFGDVYRNDILTYANGYAGHTAIAVYYDAEHKVPFDDSVVHPGGEASTAVKLYVEYIEGSYTVVRTAEQLKLARSRDIYLLDDIDMKGEKLCFDNFNGKKLLGNGFTISNFTVDYSSTRYDLVDLFDNGEKALCIAIFGNTERATVTDVTFENITVAVDNAYLSGLSKIYVAPLAVSAKDSTFKNVKVTGKFGYTKKTANSFEVDKVLEFLTDKGIYKNENSTEEGCTFEVTLAGEIE